MSDSLSLTSSITMPVLQNAGLFSPPDIHNHKDVYILYMYVRPFVRTYLSNYFAVMNECYQQWTPEYGTVYKKGNDNFI